MMNKLDRAVLFNRFVICLFALALIFWIIMEFQR